MTLLQMLDITILRTGTWADSLYDDMRWFWTFADHPEGEVPSCKDFIKYVVHNQDAYMAQLTTAQQRSNRFEIEELKTNTWRRQLKLILQDANVGPPPPTATRQFLCYECGAVFSTKSAARAHRTRHHPDALDAQRYAVGSKCTVCQVEYYSLPRLLTHLRRGGTGCLLCMQKQGPPPLSWEEFSSLKRVLGRKPAL